MELWRILLLVVASVGLSDGQVTLQPEGPEVVKAVGEIATVFCQGSGSFQPIWTDPNNNAISTTGVGRVSVTYISGTNTKLEINTFQEPDAGSYTCSGGTGGSKSITITAYKRVEFTNAPTEQSSEIYTDAKIICVITSNPPSTYEWKFKSDPIPTDDPKYTIVEYQYLQVNNISSQQDGVYTCQGTVIGGNYDTDSTDITVTVLEPPKITLAPEDFNGTLGKNARFKCIAKGNPQPVYTWEKNNVPISDGSRISIQDGGEVLEITNLISDDSGSYKCVARVEDLPNRDADHSAYLRVFIPPRVQEGVEVTAVENEEVTLTCNVVSGDNSELTWRRFGEDMPVGPQPGSADIEVIPKQDGNLLELKFSNVKRRYNGSYECFAKNAGGEDSEISNLTVNFPPVIDSARTQNEAYTSWIGNPVTMTCYWLANPPAKYFWTIEKSGIETNLTETSSTEDGASSVTLTPDSNSDFAIYRCWAWNTIQNNIEKSSPHNVELRSAAAPDAPTVKVLGEMPTTIRLEITEGSYDGGLPLISYNISWTYEFEGNDVITFKVYPYKDENVEDNELYIIENLLSAKQYKITVAAVNQYATGQYSPEETTRTLATRKPYAPPITSGEMSSEEKEYTLTWEEPEDSGLPIDGYFIQYWEFDPDRPTEVVPDGEKSIIQPFSEEVNEHTIVNLEKATDYRIELWAENAIGPGARSQIDIVTAGNKYSPTKRPPQEQGGPLSKGTIIGIVIAAFLIVLIVVDISCCIVNDCGLTMCLCVHCFGRNAPATSKTEIELGEGKGNGAVTSQQITTVDEATPLDEPTNQEINVAANGEEGGAGKGGKVAYSEIREDGDGSAPTEAPVEKDKLMGSETEQAPQTDEKTPMLSDQDNPAEPAPAADGDAKSEPPVAEPPATTPVQSAASETPAETPAEPPSVSTPEQNATDKPETKGGSDGTAE